MKVHETYYIVSDLHAPINSRKLELFYMQMTEIGVRQRRVFTCQHNDNRTCKGSFYDSTLRRQAFRTNQWFIAFINFLQLLHY